MSYLAKPFITFRLSRNPPPPPSPLRLLSSTPPTPSPLHLLSSTVTIPQSTPHPPSTPHSSPPLATPTPTPTLTLALFLLLQLLSPLPPSKTNTKLISSLLNFLDLPLFNPHLQYIPHLSVDALFEKLTLTFLTIPIPSLFHPAQTLTVLMLPSVPPKTHPGMKNNF